MRTRGVLWKRRKAMSGDFELLAALAPVCSRKRLSLCRGNYKKTIGNSENSV